MEKMEKFEKDLANSEANIDLVVPRERPALAFILKQTGTVNDDSLTAWSNKYCDYKDCTFFA